MKKDKVRLLEGALAGAALGVAAGLLFAPESGKKLRKDIQDRSVDFYKSLAPKLKKVKKMSEDEYKALVKKAAATYSKVKKLSAAEEKELVKDAQKAWHQLKKHL